MLLAVGLLLPACAPFQGPTDRVKTLTADIQVLKQTADDDGEVTAIIKLQSASLAGVEEDRVVDTLKRQAAQSQEKVLGLLKEKGATVLNTFWLTDAIVARVPVDLLDEFISLTEVERLFENSAVIIPEPSQEETLSDSEPDYAWGIETIGAPEVWDMEITGSGVRVAVLDTGVDITHPDLAGKMWTDNSADPTYPGGWIEFDAYGNIVVGSTPHDTYGHGTHCSGTALGGDASGTAIGVAPGARLMDGLVLPGGSGTLTQIMAGMEWCLDPVDQYGNSAGEPADVISMSLGGYGYYDPLVEPVANIRAAGVVLVASIGNSGEGTSNSPGNIYYSLGIGATDIDDEVALFSSGEVVDWAASHVGPYIKPDFSAPGVDVYSSVPGGEYEYWSGTSMAAPHVAGTVALLLEANPTLAVDEVYDALRETSADLGDEGQDIRYGWGRISAFAAVALVTLDCGVEGVVTDAGTDEPLEGVRIFAPGVGQQRYSDSSGHYRFFLPPGSYNMTAGTFGYYAQDYIVEVVEGVFTSLDFSLQPMPTGFIEGTVTDAETAELIQGASITLLDTPLSAATNESGQYSVRAPIGTYDVGAWTWGYRECMATNVTVAENETVIVNLNLEPVLAVVAVLGDYGSQLTDLLIAGDIWADERSWDVVDDIFHYDAVVVNQPYDPGAATFLEFLQAASDNEVGVVFTSSYGGEGISLLQWYLGDPAEQGYGHSYESNDVYYRVSEANPILEGWGEGDEVTIITGGDCDFAWFDGYSGPTVADIGSEDSGIQGDAVALGAYGDSLHVLLAGLAAQYWTNVTFWTEDAKTIFTRGVLAAAGLINVGLVISGKLPLGVVGEAFAANLSAVGGAEPYTWAITEGALPDGLQLDSDTGLISGIPTAAGTSGFLLQVTDALNVTATRELAITVIAYSEFISDPVGDQSNGRGPDITGADFCLDDTKLYLRVRTADAIDPADTVDYILLDLDLNPHTGFVSREPTVPTNDIGADAVVLVLPRWVMTGTEDKWPLPLRMIEGEGQREVTSVHALSAGLMGVLGLWSSQFGGFLIADYLPVYTGADCFSVDVSLDTLGDDGVASAVDTIGSVSEPTDVAPDEGHGITGEGPDLIIAEASEEWVDSEAGVYRVNYIVKNQGNVGVPAGHETALTVDGVLLETKEVPVELDAGESYQGSFSTNVTISAPTDETQLCADLTNAVDELSETNNCLTSTAALEPAWTRFVTDPVGDQSFESGPDIVGLDFHLDDTAIYFRIRTTAPLDPDWGFNYMWLDLDQTAATGFASGDDPSMPTNDIGAEAAAIVVPAWLAAGSSGELAGMLEFIDPDWGSELAGNFPVFTSNGYFWFFIPLDMLDDNGIMDIVDFSGDFQYGTSDVAPDESHGKTGGCFIATAAYGTDTARQLDVLRAFRDEILLHSGLGARFVSFYYRSSPAIADFISQHEVLRTIVRVGFIDPIVRVLNWTHDLWSG